MRTEWGLYDLRTPSGIKVEVKNAAYIQWWHQERFSRISFDIAPKHGCDPSTNKLDPHRQRYAEVYVFCLLAHKDQATVDPLDVDQWRFFVLATSVLDTRCAKQQTIGLASLQKLRPEEASYADVKASVQHVVGRPI